MGRSPGFGSAECNWGALLRLAFAVVTGRSPLALLHAATRRLILQKARGQAHCPWLRWLRKRGHPRERDHSPSTVCRRTVSGFYFTPLTGVLFTFPSRYWFTIGR